MSDNWNEAGIVAFLLGEDLGDVSELRGAMHEARAHLLRAVEILGNEERDGLNDPLHHAVGRALGVLTGALQPPTAVVDDWPEGDEPALTGPHPTAAEEGEAIPWPPAWTRG